MEILNKNKVILENDVSDMTTMDNPNSTTGIYLAFTKVVQGRFMDENRRGKKDREKEKSKNTASIKACLKQKQSEAFQEYQYYMDNIFLSPSK